MKSSTEILTIINDFINNFNLNSGSGRISLHYKNLHVYIILPYMRIYALLIKMHY